MDSASDQNDADISSLSLPNDLILPQDGDGWPLLTAHLPNVSESDIELPYRYGDLPRLLVKIEALAEALDAVNIDQTEFFQACTASSINYLVELWLKPLEIDNLPPTQLNGAFVGARVLLAQHYRLNGDSVSAPSAPLPSPNDAANNSNHLIAFDPQHLQQIIADAVKAIMPAAGVNQSTMSNTTSTSMQNSAAIATIANQQPTMPTKKVSLSNKLFSRPKEMDELAWIKHCKTTLDLLSNNVDQDDLIAIFVSHALPDVSQKLKDLAAKSGIQRFSTVKDALEALQNDTTTFKCQTKARSFIANAQLSDTKYANNPRQLFNDIKDHMRSFSGHLTDDQLTIEVERAFKQKMPALTQAYLCDIEEGQYLAKMQAIEENLMILSNQQATSNTPSQRPTKFEERSDETGRKFFYAVYDEPTTSKTATSSNNGNRSRNTATISPTKDTKKANTDSKKPYGKCAYCDGTDHRSNKCRKRCQSDNCPTSNDAHKFVFGTCIPKPRRHDTKQHKPSKNA